MAISVIISFIVGDLVNEKEVIQLLQQYEHDLMNEIQVIQGYLGMDNLEVAKDKMNEFISDFDKRRTLLNIDAPRFVLWLLRFNHQHKNIRLTYQMDHSPRSLQIFDANLESYCKQMVQKIYEFGKDTELYQIHLQIIQESEEEVMLTCAVIGEFNHKASIVEAYQDLEEPIEETEDGFICTFIFPLE